MRAAPLLALALLAGCGAARPGAPAPRSVQLEALAQLDPPPLPLHSDCAAALRQWARETLIVMLPAAHVARACRTPGATSCLQPFDPPEVLARNDLPPGALAGVLAHELAHAVIACERRRAQRNGGPISRDPPDRAHRLGWWCSALHWPGCGRVD